MLIIYLAITLIISFLITRSAVKMDYKHNNGYVMAEVDNIMLVLLWFVIMMLPFINVVASLIVLGVVIYERFDNMNRYKIESFLKKILFIKQDKN